MNQQQQLDAIDPVEQLQATMRYDELMQTVFQNLILVNAGLWYRRLCDSTDHEISEYRERREFLLAAGKINEDQLRRTVLTVLKRHQ